MTKLVPVAAPVTQGERIIILDSLRGFAILGILLMNITAFAYSGVLEAIPLYGMKARLILVSGILSTY
jgi:uncharacterized membrane protein YeiB